jgi:DNA-binding response OmpR family regulator
MRLLVCEDDSEVTKNLVEVLKDDRFKVQFLSLIEQVEEVLKADDPAPDIILLDRMFGDRDLVSYLDQIKEKWPSTQILILSAIDTPLEKANVIESGADDYLAKPYTKEELLARLGALYRRSISKSEKKTVIQGVGLNLEDRVLDFKGKQTELSLKECDLLNLFFSSPGKIFSKEALVQKVWKSQAGMETNAVETTIVRVRRKLEGLDAPLKIKNTRFAGYWLEV